MMTLRSLCLVVLLITISCGEGFVGYHSSQWKVFPRRNSLKSRSSATSHVGTTNNIVTQKWLSTVPMEADSDDSTRVEKPVDPLILETSMLLRRLCWTSWWAQIVLTAVSSIILLFARNVVAFGKGAINTASQGQGLPNFVLAGLGVATSFGSFFWTWATRRLANQLVHRRLSRVQAASVLRKSVNVGVTINIVGMLLSLLSAEQIVGVLAVKVLTTSRAVTLLETNSLLQPLDILVVQANTNTLFSHFVSLASLLYVSRKILKLDPPSTETDTRR